MRFKLHFKNIKISNKEVISLGLRQLQHIIFIKLHDDTNIPTIGKLAEIDKKINVDIWQQNLISMNLLVHVTRHKRLIIIYLVSCDI